MKLKTTERKKSYRGRLQPNWCDLQPIQRDSLSSKKKRGYHNQLFFLKKVSTVNPASTENLVERHRASDGDRNFTETNPNPTCIPSPM